MKSIGTGILFISSTAFNALWISSKPGARATSSLGLRHHRHHHRNRQNRAENVQHWAGSGGVHGIGEARAAGFRQRATYRRRSRHLSLLRGAVPHLIHHAALLWLAQVNQGGNVCRRCREISVGLYLYLPRAAGFTWVVHARTRRKQCISHHYRQADQGQSKHRYTCTSGRSTVLDCFGIWECTCRGGR